MLPHLRSLSLALTLLLSADCWAVVESWTILPALSHLTLSGTIDNGDLEITPQSPGANVASFRGRLVIDRTSTPNLTTELQFTGNNVIDARRNSAAPFQPSGFNTLGSEDNFGVEVIGLDGSTYFGNVRDIVFDIVGGTVIVDGSASGLSIRPSQGILNQGHTDGTTFQTMNNLSPVNNVTGLPVTIETEGSFEILTLPINISRTIPLALTNDFANINYQGSLVARKALPRLGRSPNASSVPEPNACFGALMALTAALWLQR